MKKLLYIGWLGLKNVGDELMWEVFENLCKKYKVDKQYKIVTSLEDSNLSTLGNYDAIVLGGGSILLPGYIDIIYKGLNSGATIYIWGSGYDWAEKEYLTSLQLENIPAYLYPDETEIILQELVPRCKFIGVRGPLTYSLLKKSFIDVSNLIISGDPGFALEEKPLENYMPITLLKDSDKIVAVNWGTSFNRIYGNNEEKVEDNLAKACNYLMEKGYKVYLYLVWDEDLEPLMSLYRKISPNPNLIIDTNLYKGGQLLSLLKKCIFSINFKLHGSITSATGNIPFICFGYRFKCFDFIRSINCDKLIISTDSDDIYSDLINSINYINSNYYEIKNTLKTHVDDYKTKIEFPFTNSLF